MKKIISLALYLIMSGFVLAGCSNPSEPFEKKSYTPNTQIDEIHLDVQDREIEVLLSEDEQIHIQYFENSREYYNISVSGENVLTMVSANNKEWTDYIGVKPYAGDRKISLQIPDTLFESLTLSTTNEDISLSALAVIGSVSISSIGGNIRFEKLDVGNALTLTVKNGDVSGTLVGAYDDFAIQSDIKKRQKQPAGAKGRRRKNNECFM